MAISALTVWELRASATAGNVNGGGYVAGGGGTDFTLQDAAQYALTGVTSAGAGDTFLTATAAADMVGNFAHVISGTNFTAGWYQIIAVALGVSVQVDRSLTTGIGATGVINIGGAMSLNSTLDDDFFDVPIAGNVLWMQLGAYTLGEAVSATGAGTITSMIRFEGYQTTRGDNPTGANRPTIAGGANNLALGASWMARNIIISGSGTIALGGTSDCHFENIKATNTSITTTREALRIAAGSVVFNCEAVSQNGRAIGNNGSISAKVFGCYIHDSDIGFTPDQNSPVLAFNIFANCKTAGISATYTAAALRGSAYNNTFYGASATPVGIGIRSTGAVSGPLLILNNIFCGLAGGIEIATVQQDSIMEDYCDFSNNTVDRTRIATGSHSVTTAPAFADVAEIVGSTATTSGSVLTQSGGDFSTVEDGVDYVRVVSGTGVTVGIYLITAHGATTLTVNNALGTSSAGDVVFVVRTGHDFSPTGLI